MFRGFIKKKINSYTLGEKLKKFRGEGRITLFEVSRETKIPVKYLEMIEEGEYESLPPDVYVRGFLRSYGEYLGLDPEKLVGLYQRERDIKENITKEEIKPIARTKRVPRFVVTPKIITAGVITIIILGGFFYLYKEIGRFAAEPRLSIVEPSEVASLDVNSVIVSGFTDQDAKLSINNQPVLVNEKGEFRENILLQNGVNNITVSATNRFGKAISKILNIKSNVEVPELASGPIEEIGQVNGEQAEKKEGVEVAVRIETLPVWLSVEADGNLIYSGTMLSGANQNFKGESEIRITSGKASQTFIKVNGKEEKILADSPGIVRDVVFTPSD
jgi:transcriptional regulator with XRE-family HTH domain